MSARNKPTRGAQQASVVLTFITYEEASEKQRSAWHWLCRELLSPVDVSDRPQLGVSSGGRGSKHRRRAAPSPKTTMPPEATTLGAHDNADLIPDDAEISDGV